MKILFANLEEVPDNLRDKAVKNDDGTYTYEGDGIVKKNGELLAENTRLKELAKLVKGLDTTNMTPEKIKAALEEHEKAGERETEIQSRIQAAVADNSRARQAEVDAATKKVTEMESSLERYLLDSELTTAISGEKGDATFIAPVLRSRLKVVREGAGKDVKYNVRVVKENGDIDLDTAGAPKSVLSLVQEAKKDTKFAAVFQAPVASGSGKPAAEAGAGGGAAGGGAAGALAIGSDGMVKLTREQGKNSQVYREALALVKNDYSKIAFTEGAPSETASATAA